jgi:hypothetical protein
VVAALGCGPNVAANDASDGESNTSAPPDDTGCVDGSCEDTWVDPCLDTGCDTSVTDTSPCAESGEGGCGETDTPDPCDELQCSPGVCVLGELGATCECPEGFASIGYSCIECTAAAGAWDVDIPMIQIEIEVTIDSAPAPDSPLEGGSIVLRRSRAGDTVVAGNTWDSPLVVDVMPGTYEVYYEHLAGGTIAPINERAHLGWFIVDGTTEAYPVNVHTLTLSGSFSVDGAATPASQYENGEVWLEQDGAKARLGETAAGEYSVVIANGSYEVHYGILAGGELMPLNHDAVIGEVAFNNGDEQLDVDIPTAEASGAISIDGMVPPVSDQENGEIVLADARTGDQVVVGETRDGAWSARVVAGEYEARYRWLAGGAEVPINENAHLGALAIDRGPLAIDFDIPMVAMSGAITVGGATLPDPADAGDLRLVGFDGDDGVPLGSTSTGGYDVRVVPGEYTAVYSATAPGANAPVNVGTRIGDVVVDADPTVFDLDVPVAQVFGAVTLDGAPFPGLPAVGALELWDFERGTMAPLALTIDGTFQTNVVPGIYDVTYGTMVNDGSLPINARALLATINVAVAFPLDVDVPTTELSGAITVSGQAPPAGPDTDVGILYLQQPHTGDVPPLGETALGSYVGTYVPGTYVLWYSETSAAGGVPANTNAPLACLELGG